VVKQRLKLAAVSNKLLSTYAEDEMTLEQLMAFTVTNEQARQEQAWESLSHSHNQEPYAIRRMLTEGAVPGSDKRAQFVGIEAYEAAGGVVTHDLFEEDDGGWLQDPALLDRLATEKLKSEAAKLADEGWKWITVAVNFPYGHTSGLRRLSGHVVDLSEEDRSAREALRSEYDRLNAEYAQAEELPAEIDQRLGEIEAALEAFENRPVIYDPAGINRAGVFVSIDGDGNLLFERGYVRVDDDVAEDDQDAKIDPSEEDEVSTGTTITVAGEPDTDPGDEEDGIRPLPDRLVMELTAHRTVALRDALGGSPDIAFIAVLHVLCLGAFYRFPSSDSCLEIIPRSADFAIQAPGLKDSAPAKAVDTRHESWSSQLPEQPAELWDKLIALDHNSRMALFAHCVSLTVNVVKEPHQRRSSGALAHGDVLVRALHLDMATVWSPTVDNYLGRVPKARILEAVREAKGEASAQLLDHLKKQEMATEAQRLLADTGWLPEPLRLPEPATSAAAADEPVETLPAFLAEDEDDSNNQLAAAE
jgi:ParB family chromosome partitioning protein